MRSTYYELTVRPTGYTDLFLDFLQEIFPEAIEVDEKRLIIRSEEDVGPLIEGVERFAEILSERIGEPVDVDTDVTEKENVDWIARYRASITPVEVGRYYIHPSWEPPKNGKCNIMIDPALAFGSGHHETTSGCLETIDRFVGEGDRVLDVGCGSGILSIAAAMKGAHVDACDTDPLAVENARKNFDLNGQKPRRIWEGSVASSEEMYDFVVANIVADVLCMIAPDLKKHTKDGGLLILSGILDKKEADIEEAFADFELLETIAKNEWRTKVYKKPS